MKKISKKVYEDFMKQKCIKLEDRKTIIDYWIGVIAFIFDLNFDNWKEDIEFGKFGSGASEKVWLINPETHEKGLFKFPKVKDKEKGTITGEYWAEKLAIEIGKLIDVKCARIDIGTYKGRIGSMSYNLVSTNFEENYTCLLEGIVFIENKYPYYDKDKLEDPYSNNKYSIQMIQKSLNGILKIEEFYKIVIFDILIGNSDRHHSNWAILAKGTAFKNSEDMTDINFNYSMSPLYDNGSSLCAYEDNNNVEIFFKDKMKFEALINTKYKSAIGWENERPIRHFELLKKIKDNAYDRTIQYIENIKNNINEENIDKILNEFDNDIISIDMKKLLKLYILERRKRMLVIYDLKDEV